MAVQTLNKNLRRCDVCATKGEMNVRSFGAGMGASVVCQECLDYDAYPMWIVWRGVHQNGDDNKGMWRNIYKRSLARYRVNFTQNQIDSIFECDSWHKVQTSLREM